MREPTTRVWILANVCRQDGAICLKIEKNVSYHRGDCTDFKTYGFRPRLWLLCIHNLCMRLCQEIVPGREVSRVVLKKPVKVVRGLEPRFGT